MTTTDDCRCVQLGKIKSLMRDYNMTLNKDSEARLELCFVISNQFKEQKHKLKLTEASYASVVISNIHVLKSRFGKDGLIINESDLKVGVPL